MSEACPICKGTRIVRPVFNNRSIACYNCLSEPDATGKRWPTGVIKYSKVRCPVCEGGKTITTMGGMSSVICSYCGGVGDVDESKIRADVEQIQLQDTKDAEAKADVDKSASDSNKTKRRYIRKESALGLSDNNIQECESSEQSAKEV